MRLFPLWLAASATLCAQPDTIVFSRIGPYETGLFISRADGTGERALLKPGTLDYNPAWSS